MRRRYLPVQPFHLRIDVSKPPGDSPEFARREFLLSQEVRGLIPVPGGAPGLAWPARTHTRGPVPGPARGPLPA